MSSGIGVGKHDMSGAIDDVVSIAGMNCAHFGKLQDKGPFYLFMAFADEDLADAGVFDVRLAVGYYRVKDERMSERREALEFSSGSNFSIVAIAPAQESRVCHCWDRSRIRGGLYRAVVGYKL